MSITNSILADDILQKHWDTPGTMTKMMSGIYDVDPIQLLGDEKWMMTAGTPMTS